MKYRWKLHQQLALFEKYFRLDEYHVSHELFEGGESPVFTREIFERGVVVALLPYDPHRRKVVLIEQFRAGAIDNDDGPWLIECVAGVIENGESEEQVARRECVEEAGCEVDVETEVLQGPSTGSGITLWSGYKGASALGERGLPAEKVGRSAAKEMLAELRSKAAVDVHLADQLVPYLALAGGRYTASQISRHTRTNIWTVSHFSDVEISVVEGDVVTIQAEP